MGIGANALEHNIFVFGLACMHVSSYKYKNTVAIGIWLYLFHSNSLDVFLLSLTITDHLIEKQ
jgi:hypothetical protein